MSLTLNLGDKMEMIITEVKDEESMKRAEEKLMYFFQRQMNLNKEK